MAGANSFWGNLVVKLRQEQKMSQRKLASKARVDRSTLRRIEESKMSGNINVMERLFNHLGYELEVFATESVQERLRRQALDEANPEKRSQMAMDRILAM